MISDLTGLDIANASLLDIDCLRRSNDNGSARGNQIRKFLWMKTVTPKYRSDENKGETARYQAFD